MKSLKNFKLGLFSALLWIVFYYPLCHGGEYSANITTLKPDNIVIRWTPLAGAQHYRVEYRDSLTSGSWLACPLPDQWVIGTNIWIEPAIKTTPERFYRVVAITELRGQRLYSALFRQLSISQLAALFSAYAIPITPRYAVNVYQVYYTTPAPDGMPTRASSAIMIPLSGSRALPLLSYQHGTEFLTNKVASQGDGEYVMGLAFAASGYVTSMPDYLGMGSGSGLHPYVHARSEATCAIDSLRCEKSLCAELGVSLNGQLFLIGYSQGGQATMALHKELETYHTNEFQITASAPMAGPYDMSGTMANLMTSDQPYSSPAYLAFTLFSYNSVYRLVNSVSEILREPYATTLPPLFDGRHSSSQINSAMPSVPSQIFKTDFLNEFRSNPQHPWRAVLKANDLFNWRPRAPMRMYHCRGDTTVPYANSEVALTNFHNLGATYVQLIDPNPSADHGSGAAYCFLSAFQWFETLKQ